MEGDTILHSYVKGGDAFHLEEKLKVDSTGIEDKNSLSVSTASVIICAAIYTSSDFCYSQHTALYVACERGEVACVKVLLGHGACMKYTHGSNNFSCLNAAIDANRRYGPISYIETQLSRLRPHHRKFLPALSDFP